MIGAWDVIGLVYVAGVVYHAPRILKRWSLITTCDPTQLCDGCRDERTWVMRQADFYEVMGVFGLALMVILQAGAWYLKPLVPAIRRAIGKELLPVCSKGSCLAHTRREAAA